MTRMVALLLLPITIAGCSGGGQALGKPTGKYRALNVGKWSPTRDDLRGPRAPLPPSQSPSLAQPTVQGAGA